MSVWGCLGAEAPRLTYSLCAAGHDENPRKGVFSTRLVQDITRGETFHYVNIDSLSQPDQRALPGDAFDVAVELTHADGSTVLASSPPQRVVVTRPPGTYAANFGDPN